MNKVDYLMSHPFHSLKDEEKMNIKLLGPDHPQISIIQKHKTQTRTFNFEWYKRKPWLTASESKKALFCFSCLLFGGDRAWTRNGIRDLKHLSEKIKMHEQTACHIGNSLKLSLFGKADIRSQLDEGFRISVQRHNEQVDKNRHILGRIIDCIHFCGRHELPLRGHDETESSLNRGIFLDLINEIAKLDSQLNEHLAHATVCKLSSASIQNELLDCMYEVYRESLKEIINEAMFLSIQADETTDISNKSQLVIVLRFVKGTKVVEKFHSFVNVHDRSAAGISNYILPHLESYDNLKEKLIAQTYDGASVMSGSHNGVQKFIRDVYPYAYFLHCYAHQLNLVMQKVCSVITSVRIFFANLSAFPSFFSVSSKRTELLQEVCNRRLPRAITTRWNFQSRTVRAVYENKDALMECFNKIQEEERWDSISIREASGLISYLEDEEFCFFLEFFNEIMPLIDLFYNIVQKNVTTPISVRHHLELFCASMNEIRRRFSESLNSEPTVTSSSISSAGRRSKRKRSDRTTLAACAIECCDIILTETQDRFGATDHLECFNLVDPTKFAEFKCHFPVGMYNCSKFYPFIEGEKLKNELCVLYSSEEFKNIKSVNLLYSFLVENNLQGSFSETVKLLNIVLTSPVATAESERCFSTLKRVKSYLRNTMGQDRLNALSVLTIEKEFLSEISDFKGKVIKKFAEQKNRRANFLYK